MALFADDSFGASATGAAVGPESVANGQGTMQLKLATNPTTGVVGTLAFTNPTNSLDGVWSRGGSQFTASLSGLMTISGVVQCMAHMEMKGVFQPAQTPYDPTTQTVTNATITGQWVISSIDHT